MDDNGDAQKGYNRYTRRKVLFVAVFALIAILAVGSSVTVGGRTMSFTEVYATILDHILGHEPLPGTEAWMDDYIVWDIRLPRAVFAIIAGAGLAVCGTAMQSVMKNPLADPFTTGISSGACFGVAIAAILGLSVMNGGTNLGSIANAFVFALLPMLALLFIAPRKNISPATLILMGIAISYMFNSLTTILLTFTDADTLADIYRWQIGTIENITWDCVPIPLMLTVAGSIVLVVLSKHLNILALGDDQATSLGLNVEKMRLVILVLISLVAASIIAYAGIIGFVGLISPHIVRMVIDADNRFVIPGAAMFGASFLLICDIITRWISNVEAVPVGIVVSFLGAPVFLYLIIKQKRAMW